MNSTKNLWILTEERPKKTALQKIFEYFATDHNCGFIGQDVRLIPILNEDKCFDFTYEVIGFSCAKINKVYIKTVSGLSSFVDFLVFYQDEEPMEGTEPLYAIEVTKTDDKESRNTGVYQRCSKFIFLRFFYPNTKMIMLYVLQVEQKKNPTKTYIFGTKLLRTFGVDILGKVLDSYTLKPFDSIDEIIAFKKSMNDAHKGNVPILITKDKDVIKISGRLYKSGRLAHDPNIGALSIIAACLRKLGWKNRIIITQHGLVQNNIGQNGKFVQIANKLNIELEGLIVPQATLPKLYWHYDIKGEKLATIFMHVIVESFTESYSIFENHAGCEKGYFYTSSGECIPLKKYYDRQAYKSGNKSQIIFIPDLVLIDVKEKEIIEIEGKKYECRQNGINELNNYDTFDECYVKKYYLPYKIVRTVVVYGGSIENLCEIEIGFLLNEKGKMILGIKAPKLFIRAIRNLLNYWN